MPFRFFLQESVSCGTRKWDEYGQKIAIKSDFVVPSSQYVLLIWLWHNYTKYRKENDFIHYTWSLELPLQFDAFADNKERFIRKLNEDSALLMTYC